ncbi:MAG: hydrogenase maturation factor [Lachnospiraceae bacterium]|nr:hydrogenase maturation factor [Lachnospiraceae bacterium]
MKKGKVSENVLKRSVLRQIKNPGKEVLKGAGVGNDCAFLSWDDLFNIRMAGEAWHPLFFPRQEENGSIGITTQTFTLPVKNAAYLAVMAAANNLAAAGAVPAAVTLSITLPEEAEEILLKEIMRQANTCCGELGMQIVGGHTEVSSLVRQPVITVSAIGKGICDKGRACAADIDNGRMTSALKPGGEGKRDNLDILVSKWIGLEGTCVIAYEKEKELAGRYPRGLILEAQRQDKYLSVAPEAAIALKSGVYVMHDIRNGGIFGALWELSQKMGVGLYIDLKKIPVRQETIEICEFYRLNPYELLSGGALLMAAADGAGLERALAQKGIPAAVIGSTREGNDRVIVNQDETRYLGPSGPDEILKVPFI